MITAPQIQVERHERHPPSSHGTRVAIALRTLPLASRPDTPPGSAGNSGTSASQLPAFRQSWAVWIELGARYEAARARSRVGLTLRALGDEDSAVTELAIARRTFSESAYRL